jgi:2-polyprenyl-6-methoxyphenol hydroxylase-like FAD-dependent oxidoreductase
MGSLLQVKFDASGLVNRSNGKLGTFIRNLPADKEFFNILPGNFDRERCCTPITVFAFMNELLREKLRSEHAPSTETHQEDSADAEEKTEEPGDAEHPAEEVEDNTSSLIVGTAAEADHHKEAFNIDDHPIMKSDLMQVLHRVCPRGIMEGTLKITILPVEYKVARTVSYCHERVPIFLVGDAAMGLPLEKGLNYGWKIASRLCRYIAFCENYAEAITAYEGYFGHASQSALASVTATFSRYANDAYAASVLRSILKPLSGVRVMIKTTQSSKQQQRPKK